MNVYICFCTVWFPGVIPIQTVEIDGYVKYQPAEFVLFVFHLFVFFFFLVLYLDIRTEILSRKTLGIAIVLKVLLGEN